MVSRKAQNVAKTGLLDDTIAPGAVTLGIGENKTLGGQTKALSGFKGP